MAAGLGFKTFLSGDVLSAGDVNGYLMQGVLVFASAAARDAAITSPQEGQYAYLKDTNVTYYYSGSAWVSASAASPLTTKGDVYTFSTVDARIGVGANDTVLTADSAQATGLKWATPVTGSMTLISTTTLSGSAVNLTSIPQTYKDLKLVIRNFRPSTDSATMQFRINSDSGTKYIDRETSALVALSVAFTETTWNGTSSDNGASTGILVADLYDYTNSGTIKMGQRQSIANNATTPANAYMSFSLYATNITDAITSINILVSAGTFTSGTALLYGVN
jgi:hypothetical protein